MRHLVHTTCRRLVLGGLTVAALAVPLGLSSALPGGAAFAQGKPPAAAADDVQPKQVALSQKIIDNLLAAQKQIHDVESKMPQNGQPDPKADAKIDGIVKSSGFGSMNDFSDASYSVGLVLSGMDDSGNYIGTQAALQKQKAEVQADKKMPAKEKKEALAELDAAMKQAGTEKPMPGNIDLVKTNAAKLSEGLGD